MEFNKDDSLGFILNRTSTKFKNELFQRFKEYDVTPEQWSVLNCLWEQEGVTPKELADMISKDKPNTNRILEKLEAKDFIVRKPHPADKRSFQIFLTDRGVAIKEDLIPKALKVLDDAVRGIEECKIEEMKKLLNQMYYNLK